jgi:hypothetical protein
MIVWDGGVADMGSLRVYDVLGREVKRFKVSGLSRVRWDLRDEQGKEVGNGIYFVRCEAGKVPSVTRRVTVLKTVK